MDLNTLRSPKGARGLLIAMLVAMIGFTVVVLVVEQQNAHTQSVNAQRFQASAHLAENALVTSDQAQRKACFGSGDRAVQMLQSFYVIYQADQTAGRTSPNRKREAGKLFRHMRASARDRIDTSFASQLPGPLARIVTAARFSCDRAYSLPQPAT